MKTIIIILGFLIVGVTAYSQGGMGSIGGVELPDSTVFTSELNNALEDSLQANRDRDDAAYHTKGDTLGLSGRINLKLDISDTATMKSGLRSDISDSISGLEAGATALDDIGDPDAATTIGLDDGETIIINSAEDAGTVLTINMTDADAGGNIFGIDLIHAGDANSTYQFMRCFDNTSDLQFDIASNGNVTTAGTMVAGSWIRCNYGDIISRKIHDTPATTPAFNLQKARDGTPTDNVSDEDYIGEINFRGYHTDEYSKGATIRAIVDDTPGEDDMPSRLEFLTSSDGSDAPAVRLTIDAIGNAIFTDTIKADKDVTIGDSISLVNALTGTFNVLDYKAVGDGITNCTDEIAACITAAGNGATVFFPAGTYIVDSILVINDIWLKGVGWGGYGSGTGTMIRSQTDHDIIILNPSSTRAGAKVTDMYIYGGGATKTNQTGISINSFHGSTIERVYIDSCGDYAVKIGDTEGTWSVNINNNRFQGNEKGGIYFKSHSSKQVNNIRIFQNEISANDGYGINCHGTNILINDNVIQGNDSSGIFLSGRELGAVSSSSNNIFMAGNYIESNGGGNIYIEYYYSGGIAQYHFGAYIDNNYLNLNTNIITKPGVTANITLAEATGSGTTYGIRDLFIGRNNNFAGTAANVNANDIVDYRNVIMTTKENGAVETYYTNLGTSSHYAYVRSGTADTSAIIPYQVGDIYIDTDDGEVYISKGNSASEDWVKVSNRVPLILFLLALGSWRRLRKLYKEIV